MRTLSYTSLYSFITSFVVFFSFFSFLSFLFSIAQYVRTCCWKGQMCSADGRTTQRLQGRVLFFPTAVSMVVETEMIERGGLCALSGTKWGRGPTLCVTKQHCSNRPLRFGSRGGWGGVDSAHPGSGMRRVGFEVWMLAGWGWRQARYQRHWVHVTASPRLAQGPSRLYHWPSDLDFHPPGPRNYGWNYSPPPPPPKPCP